MSREILFRGKTEDGLWRIGYLSFEDKITIKRKCYDYKGDYVATSIEEYKIDKNTIGQFTGLTDKNGKKIFEGDIVKAIICINDWSRDKVRNEEGIYEIKYHTKHCYFYLAKEGNNLLFDGNWHYYLKEIKVIGNIHDQDIGENKWWNT